jgi:hypothetical protein
MEQAPPPNDWQQKEHGSGGVLVDSDRAKHELTPSQIQLKELQDCRRGGGQTALLTIHRNAGRR